MGDPHGAPTWPTWPCFLNTMITLDFFYLRIRTREGKMKLILSIRFDVKYNKYCGLFIASDH